MRRRNTRNTPTIPDNNNRNENNNEDIRSEQIPLFSTEFAPIIINDPVDSININIHRPNHPRDMIQDSLLNEFQNFRTVIDRSDFRVVVPYSLIHRIIDRREELRRSANAELRNDIITVTHQFTYERVSPTSAPVIVLTMRQNGPFANIQDDITAFEFFRNNEDGGYMIDVILGVLLPYFSTGTGRHNVIIKQYYQRSIKTLKSMKYMQVKRFLIKHPFVSWKNLEKKCIICLDDFKPKRLVYLLKCRHIFHVSCITNGKNINGLCPVCRQELDTTPLIVS